MPPAPCPPPPAGGLPSAHSSAPPRQPAASMAQLTGRHASADRPTCCLCVSTAAASLISSFPAPPFESAAAARSYTATAPRAAWPTASHCRWVCHASNWGGGRSSSGRGGRSGHGSGTSSLHVWPGGGVTVPHRAQHAGGRVLQCAWRARAHPARATPPAKAAQQRSAAACSSVLRAAAHPDCSSAASGASGPSKLPPSPLSAPAPAPLLLPAAAPSCSSCSWSGATRTRGMYSPRCVVVGEDAA